MSRRKKVNYKEEDSEEEEADFSASEDEWKPNEVESSEAESEDEHDDDFDAVATARFSKKGSIAKNNPRLSSTPSRRRSSSSSKQNRTISTLRHRMIKKYNPLPRTVLSSPAKTINKDIKKIIEESQYKGKKSIASSHDEDDSDSSGDDYLIQPNKLDLKSSFFDIAAMERAANSQDAVPEFDCNAGMKLSDSEEDDDEQMEEVESTHNSETQNSGAAIESDANEKKKSHLIAGINQKSAGQMDFQQLIKYNKDAHDAEEKLRNIKSASFKNEDVNVSKLLALGEGTSASAADMHSNQITQANKSKSQQKRKKATKDDGSDSETDWEQVQETESALIFDSKDILQINIPTSTKTSEDKKKSSRDIELMIKRKLNRDIKEYQLYLHKVSLVCHIAHGLHCNRVLNTPALMSAALKLLPNKTCYPDGATCIKYFESLAKWYKQAVPIRKNQMYLGTKKRPPIGVSLALQIKFKEALCKKDFVLIFVILLRAMGFPCRLVVNLTPVSLRPPTSELHSLSTKAKNEKSGNQKSKAAVKKDSSYEKHTSMKQIKKEHGYCEEKKAKSKCKESKEIKTETEEVAPKTEQNERSSRSKPKAEVAEKNLKSEKQSTIHLKENKTLPEKQTSSKPTEKRNISKTKKSGENNEDSAPAKKPIQNIIVETKVASKTTANDAVGSTDGPSAPKRGRPSRASKLLAKSLEAAENSTSDKRPRSALEKPLTRSRNSPINIKNVNDNLPPILEKAETASSNTMHYEEAPLLASSTIKTKTNPIASDNQKLVANSQVDVKVIEDPEGTVTSKAVLKPKMTKKNIRPVQKSPIESQEDKRQSTAPEHFKEIKKNVLKRTRNNPKSNEESSPSALKAAEKVESIYFRAPSARATRSQAKQQKTANTLAVPQLDGADDGHINLKKLKKSPKPLDSDDDFVPSPAKKPRPSNGSEAKEKSNKQRKVLSSSSEDEGTSKNTMDVWVEVYAEKEDKWVALNLFKTQVNKPDGLRKSATNPVAYVFAWNNDNTIKDVSPRYCPLWNTATRKQRVDKEWLMETIDQYLEKRTRRSKAEDVEFHRMHLDKPLPTSIAEYKNHPLYALQRHLLKFEAIYPENALTLGFVRGEPVYARDCVHTLHSRETWLRDARVVKPGEKPYKIVKSRPKWDRATNSVITDIPLEIFGKWQTMDYEPPIAQNGIVPRNAYGNVDLFKPSMLPKKTVLLELPGINKVCKKLKIDCAAAVVGFDFHQGACHPIIQGYVVCEEHQDTVVDAWNRHQEEAERKEDEKYYQRVYGNWKKLYRGLLIRERLKRKYNFKTLQIDDGKPKKKKRT